MGPSTRNNRKPDDFGIWHCHDKETAKNFLMEKNNDGRWT